MTDTRYGFGVRFNPSYCKESVHDTYGVGFHQCNRPPTRDGYCGQHHPDAKARRQAKRDKKTAEYMARYDARSEVAAAESHLVDMVLKLEHSLLAPTLKAAAKRVRKARKACNADILLAAFAQGTAKAIAATRAAGLPVHAMRDGVVVEVPERPNRPPAAIPGNEDLDT